ncbi:MAG: MFS transporter [Calditrichaeota bacterium]|nr:MFS transporter [Calditrichota bacterium]
MEVRIKESNAFSTYQKLIIFLLATTQFTVILDFVVMSPLGDMMMKSLKITTSQFGAAVSAYAFSAGISGLLTAGFADRFDRKKLLVVFYIGFIGGTLFCGLAPDYHWLVIARIITGLFGGVIGATTMAIVTDLFTFQQRGKAMGFLTMGFSVSQVLGIPIGLYIANIWGWHIPFIWIALMSALLALTLYFKMSPIVEHLSMQRDKSAFQHLWHVLNLRTYKIGFLTTALLSVGGFMLMPFGSAFAINNLKITEQQLPLLFMFVGIGTFIAMPIIGTLSDKVSKFRIFATTTVLAVIIMNIYGRYAATPFYIVLLTLIPMMMAIMGRVVPAMALTSSLPKPQDRGAFMSLNSSLQQISGGFGAMISGLIIFQENNYAPLQEFDTMVVIASTIMLFTIYLMYQVNKLVNIENESQMPQVSQA